MRYQFMRFPDGKTKGLVRSEGKEYVMRDGDIVNFLFNVGSIINVGVRQ